MGTRAQQGAGQGEQERLEEIDLGVCDWLGFDVDHTLVRYDVPALTKLIHDSLAAFLVHHRGYDAAAFTAEPDTAFFAKGLLFDAQAGNFLRLRADGHIIAASHGTQPLSPATAEAMYTITPAQAAEAASSSPSSTRQQRTSSSSPFRSTASSVSSSSGSSHQLTGSSSSKGPHAQSSPLTSPLMRRRSSSEPRRLRHGGPSKHLQPQSRGQRQAAEAEELRTHTLADICAMLLEEGVKHPRFFYFSTFFDMPGAAVLAQAIDAIDAARLRSHRERVKRQQEQQGQKAAGKGRVNGKSDASAEQDGEIPYHWKVGSYDHVLQTLKDALTHNFTPSQFSANGGFFFPQLKKEPSRYVLPATPALVKWLANMRTRGVRLFLLTNSHVDFATFLLEFAFGTEWQSQFDLVIFAASKPGFFEKASARTRVSFFHPVGTTNVTGPAAGALALGQSYVHGNLPQLQELLNKRRNPNVPANKRNKHASVVYFGDHLVGDIMAAERHTSWRTVAVVEELVTLHPELETVAPTADTPTTTVPTRSLVQKADAAVAQMLLDSLDRWGHLIHLHTSAATEKGAMHRVTLKDRTACTLFESILRNHAAFAVPHLEALVTAASTRFEAFAPHDSGRGVHHHRYTHH